MIQRTSDYKINNTTFRVTYGNITQIVADALVSSDDNYLSMGGGVSMALLNAGGEEIRQEARKHIPLKIGDVAVTSAGRLPAKFIFHAVTIDYDYMIFPSETTIRAATLKCMKLADTLGVRLIAFPALGTGVAKFPFQLAAEVMTRTIADYLMGDTRIELVTITLFTGRMARESVLNVFYERAVALASVSTQSKRLSALLAELRRIIEPMQKSELTRRVVELQSELTRAQGILAESPASLEHLEQLQERSAIAEVSQQVVGISKRTQEAIRWDDRQLEAEVLRTRLNGLLTQLNIQTSQLNRFQIEKAKYGGIGVPPRLENAIEDLNREISEIEARVKEARMPLATLTTASDENSDTPDVV